MAEDEGGDSAQVLGPRHAAGAEPASRKRPRPSETSGAVGEAQLREALVALVTKRGASKSC